MSIAEKIPARAQPNLPDAAFLKDRAAGGEPILLYQPYLGADQKTRVDAGAIALDISFNTQPGSREYELFKILHEHHRAAGIGYDVFWGLVSTKFEHKSCAPVSTFLKNAKEARLRGFDCYVHNPMIGYAAIYSNVWEQALMGGHKGLDLIFQHLVKLGYPLQAAQGQATFSFCNYVCGNEKFWSGYFAFCEPALAELEKQAQMNTDVGQSYASRGHYARDANTTMRPFVAERLLSLYLQKASAQQGLNVSSHIPTLADFEWKFGARVGAILFRLYTQKNAALESRNAAAFSAWQQARKPLIMEPFLVWQSDDPPAWLSAS